MISLMVIAGLTVLGFLIVMFKLGLRKVLGYDLYVDVGLTIALIVMFSGSFSGMSVALIGGLLISVILLVLRKFIGYERYEEFTFDNDITELTWVRYKGWFA